MLHKSGKRTYIQLLQLIRKEIRQGALRARQVVNHQMVVTNWNVGRHIAEHLLGNNGRAAHGRQVFDRLARDLGTNVRLLNLCVQFYREYPALPKESSLSWSHYRILLTFSDAAQRKRWEGCIIKENLSSSKFQYIKRQIKAKIPAKISDPIDKLPEERGQLYTYRMIQVRYTSLKQPLVMVDCGFDIRREVPAGLKIKYQSGDLVESIKTGKNYRLKHISIPRNSIYTYKAFVERVIDGDSLIVNVDCGFGMWTRQRLRLRGIDTPELTTVRGQEAKKFVEKALRKSSFVIIKTYGSGKYGRYLADVFYLPKETDSKIIAEKGNFLNQELLSNRLAVRV